MLSLHPTPCLPWLLPAARRCAHITAVFRTTFKAPLWLCLPPHQDHHPFLHWQPSSPQGTKCLSLPPPSLTFAAVVPDGTRGDLFNFPLTFTYIYFFLTLLIFDTLTACHVFTFHAFRHWYAHSVQCGGVVIRSSVCVGSVATCDSLGAPSYVHLWISGWNRWKLVIS